jgi:hypothetical protein
MEPPSTTPSILVLTDDRALASPGRSGEALRALGPRTGRPTRELHGCDPGVLARALSEASEPGLLVVSSSRPSELLAVARAHSVPTMLLLRSYDCPDLDDLEAEVSAAMSDGLPTAGWLPHRWDPRSRAVDATLGDDRLGGLVASRIVRLDPRGAAPVHDLVDLVDLAMLWHDRPLTSLLALGARDSFGAGSVALRFEDGGGALLECGTTTSLPGSGYDETLLIGRTRTLDLPWEVLHEARVDRNGASPGPLFDPDEQLVGLLTDWTERPATVAATAPAAALLTALRVTDAIDRSARTGEAVPLTGITTGGPR